MRPAFGTALFGLGLGLWLAGCATGPERLRVATTEAIVDSGTWRDVFTAFERQSGLTVDLMPVGSATALALAARGDVALAMVDSVTDQQAFVVRGHARGAQPLGRHRYLLVGPTADPANVRGKAIVEALRGIAEAGASFVGQPTRSGVDRLERDLWVKAGVRPQGSWYRPVAGTTAETLRVAAERQGYVLCEASAFRRAKSADHGLVPLVDDDAALLVTISLLPGTSDGDAARRSVLVDYLAQPAVQQTLQQAGIEPLPLSPAPAGPSDRSAQSI